MSAECKAAREALDRTLAQVGALEALLGDFQGDNAAVHAQLNEYVASLGALHAAGAALHRAPTAGGPAEPIEVPAELLRYVDDGGNPDVFVAEVMRSCQAANQGSRGKVEAFRAWRDCLVAQAAERYPAVVADYVALRSGGGAPAAPG